MAHHLINSDATIKAIKPGDSRTRLSDGDGLYLRLFVKGGSHGWRFDYSMHGARNTLSLGTYPETGLSLARKKAADARALVAAGIDPSEARKQAKAGARQEHQAKRRADAGLPSADSFEAIAREWLSTVHSEGVSAGHAERTRIRFEQDLFPWIGREPINSIKAPALLACLRRVEARGAVETAHRIKQGAGQVFRYAIASGLCDRDPSADLRGALKPIQSRNHAAITDPGRVGELLRAIDAYKGQAVTRAALRLAPLVFQRPGEIRKAEWVEMDLDAGLWTIRAERMKGNKQRKATGPDHVVPLSHQAVAVLRELHPLTGEGQYVFPGLRSITRPMSDAALIAALRRMGYDSEEMTAHGFRAMARTMLAERLGVEESVIEAQLAHAVRDSLGRSYNRTTWVDQRRDMMQQWADYLDRLKTGAEIVPIGGRTGCWRRPNFDHPCRLNIDQGREAVEETASCG